MDDLIFHAAIRREGEGQRSALQVRNLATCQDHNIDDGNEEQRIDLRVTIRISPRDVFLIGDSLVFS